VGQGGNPTRPNMKGTKVRNASSAEIVIETVARCKSSLRESLLMVFADENCM
jgi:hypothetical protein